MENYGNLHTQLVSIVEVLANTAVLEICKLVDDGFTHLRLEVSRAQRENLELKNRLRLIEGGAPVPLLGSGSERGYSAEHLLGGQDEEPSKLEEKPAVVIKAEQLEEELTGCIMGERHAELPASGTVVECPSLAPESAGVGGAGGGHAQQGGGFLTSNPGSSHVPRSEWASPSLCVDEDPAGIKTPTEEESPSLDSFHELFSSPDVAQSLSTPGLWEGGAEERLASSFSFLTSSSSSVARDSLNSDGRGHRAGGPFSGPSGGAPGPPRPPARQLLPTAGRPAFGCGVCGKHFSQSSHIKRHMSVHTGARPYGCAACGKSFSQACSLKVHQAVHTGERPYGCSQCGKRFSLLGNMVRHQALHSTRGPQRGDAALSHQ